MDASNSLKHRNSQQVMLSVPGEAANDTSSLSCHKIQPSRDRPPSATQVLSGSGELCAPHDGCLLKRLAERAEVNMEKPKQRRTTKVLTMPRVVADAPSAPITTAAIAGRAYELYEQRGSDHGHDVDDWLQAERELAGEVGVSVA